MRVFIEPYGAFREVLGESELEVPEGAKVGQLKQLLQERLGKNWQTLVDRSVLADEEKILGENDPITSARLALLPPVSGGYL